MSIQSAIISSSPISFTLFDPDQSKRLRGDGAVEDSGSSSQSEGEEENSSSDDGAVVSTPVSRAHCDECERRGHVTFSERPPVTVERGESCGTFILSISVHAQNASIQYIQKLPEQKCVLSKPESRTLTNLCI